MTPLTRALLETDTALGGPCRVVFGGVEIGVYETADEMQVGIAAHILDDLYQSAEGEEGEDYDYDSLHDEAVEHSLVVLEAFKGNTADADATTINVEVNGGVHAYNGVWTFEFL